MKSVLMVGPDRTVHGGISGVVNNYYEAGLDQKIRLRYIGTMKEGSKLYKLFVAALAVVRFLVCLPGYEIVHVNMASDRSYLRKAVFVRLAKRFGKKIVIHQHGGDFQTFYHKENNEKGQKKIREVLNMADAFLVLAPFWKDFFGELIDPDKITVLPDSIEIPEPYDKRYEEKKILFLGRLCKAKGIGELLQCMPKLHEKFPSMHLYLAGIWEDKDLEVQAKQYADCVTYLGWLSGEEKKEWLKKCEMLVLPSYFEGQSVSLLEAMANYCAIVATDTGGIPMMIEDGNTGILVKPKDAGDLARGLSTLLEYKELCSTLGAKARYKAETEFSMEQNMNVLVEEIYGRL